MNIPLPAIIVRQPDMLVVIDKDNVLALQANNWQHAYAKWQQLIQHTNWNPAFAVTIIGDKFYQILRTITAEIILSTNNHEDALRKVYRLNYSAYSEYWQEKKNNTYNPIPGQEIKPENVAKSPSHDGTPQSTLETLRDQLIKMASSDKALTSRMILDIPEALDLPIDQYEQLCHMLVMSGILLFDTEEQLKKWQEKNAKKQNSSITKTGKSFNFFFKKAISIDDTQKVMINELMSYSRLPKGGTRYYLERAEKGNKEAISKLFLHYSGPVIRSAIKFYEANPLHSLALGDLIQESLLLLYKAIFEIRTVGRKQFNTSLPMRLYYSFTRIWIADLPIRIPAHIFEKIKSELDSFIDRNSKYLLNNQVSMLSRKLDIEESLAAKIMTVFYEVDSIENIEIMELEARVHNHLPLLNMENNFLIDIVQKTLETLSSREKEIVEKRFGINSKNDSQNKTPPRTLEEIAQDYGVTRERIRQIEQKALRRLRHPSRAQKLKDYYLEC